MDQRARLRDFEVFRPQIELESRLADFNSFRKVLFAIRVTYSNPNGKISTESRISPPAFAGREAFSPDEILSYLANAAAYQSI